jgi:hypothetical protein
LTLLDGKKYAFQREQANIKDSKRYRGMYQNSRKGTNVEDVDKFNLEFCFFDEEKDIKREKQTKS